MNFLLIFLSYYYEKVEVGDKKNPYLVVNEAAYAAVPYPVGALDVALVGPEVDPSWEEDPGLIVAKASGVGRGTPSFLCDSPSFVNFLVISVRVCFFFVEGKGKEAKFSYLVVNEVAYAAVPYPGVARLDVAPVVLGTDPFVEEGLGQVVAMASGVERGILASLCDSPGNGK